MEELKGRKEAENIRIYSVAGAVSGGQEMRDIGQPSGERSCFDAFIAVRRRVFRLISGHAFYVSRVDAR